MSDVIGYSDYTGPQGRYAIVDGSAVAVTPGTIRRLSLNAHLLALGSPEKVEELVERAKVSETVLAHTF